MNSLFLFYFYLLTRSSTFTPVIVARWCGTPNEGWCRQLTKNIPALYVSSPNTFFSSVQIIWFSWVTLRIRCTTSFPVFLGFCTIWNSYSNIRIQVFFFYVRVYGQRALDQPRIYDIYTLILSASTFTGPLIVPCKQFLFILCLFASRIVHICSRHYHPLISHSEWMKEPVELRVRWNKSNEKFQLTISYPNSYFSL